MSAYFPSNHLPGRATLEEYNRRVSRNAQGAFKILCAFRAWSGHKAPCRYPAGLSIIERDQADGRATMQESNAAKNQEPAPMVLVIDDQENIVEFIKLGLKYE